MTIEKLKELANNLLLEPSKEVFELSSNLLSLIDTQLKELDEINLDNVKPISHINENKISFFDLRDDEINDETKITKENILENAYQSDDNLVIMKRVVNGE
ncbi:Asp-tRNA(Asn)/Glu-tRNA(Gln) amidotransferase subunit GatC [Metamycoplasma canadense]|uniref:Glutamyl-tRNA (Gln) amidotransferase subunit C n=1 Tax=Metamycoplasma canadense TaxID=29554 RepID=A0A077L6L7_9BACT|nr:Asp-tRNA(Asn)/Glu-tRNA(Gln) amidotransferase subunit GatC [Metamycoplasma canadense]BAP39617.1 glutamyl-tRNA (Gln) amidotransferase subunit C [Metamycoplasma canadense]